MSGFDRRIHDARSNAGRRVDTPIFLSMMKEIQRKGTRREGRANADVTTGAGVDPAEVRHVGFAVRSEPPADLVPKRRLTSFGHDLPLQRTSPMMRHYILRKHINFRPQTHYFQRFIDMFYLKEYRKPGSPGLWLLRRSAVRVSVAGRTAPADVAGGHGDS